MAEIKHDDPIRIALRLLELWGDSARRMERPPNDYPNQIPTRRLTKMAGDGLGPPPMAPELFDLVDRVVSGLKSCDGEEHEIARLVWVQGMPVDRAAQVIGMAYASAYQAKRAVIWWVAGATAGQNIML